MAEKDGISFYNVDEAYVDYLLPHAPHLFRNAKATQVHSRKYIGVVLRVGSFDYFAPLSSFKEKHRRMKNSLDLVKVKDYAVINLNNMFPVPPGCCQRSTSLPSPTGATATCCRPSTAPSSPCRTGSAGTRPISTGTRSKTATRPGSQSAATTSRDSSASAWNGRPVANPAASRGKRWPAVVSRKLA